MEYQIHPGELVECVDGLLGTVEEIVTDAVTHEPEAILVEHGHAGYLLRVPDRHIAGVTTRRVKLDVRVDEAQMSAIEYGAIAPDREHITDGGPTEPCPLDDEVLGCLPYSPAGGPATG